MVKIDFWEYLQQLFFNTLFPRRIIIWVLIYAAALRQGIFLTLIDAVALRQSIDSALLHVMAPAQKAGHSRITSSSRL